MEKLQGRLRRILFHDDDWVVAVLESGSTVVGNMMRPSFGVDYTFNGDWVVHERYGRQFKIESFSTEMPTDPLVVQSYLMENAKWIGPHVAMQITEIFGKEALEICKVDPERVAKEVRGITLERAEDIADMLAGVEADETLSIQLKELFLNIPVQKRALKAIAKKWRGDAPKIIRENPYVLPDEIAGIGFATADLVGRRVGIKPNDPKRLRGGIMHTIREASRTQGHTCVPRNELLKRARQVLSSSQSSLGPVLDDLIGRLVLRERQDHVYLPVFYDAELYVAKKLARMSRTPPPAVELDLTQLAEDQVEAVTKCLQSRVSILTGAPGTGKSFSITRITNSLQGKTVYLCAPTGKAAKRVTEHTGRLATTIHKLLAPQPMKEGGRLVFKFGFDENHPLPCSAVVVDEMSMVDIRLFASLLKALTDNTRLILIGDVHQLPSVGPGNVLRDLIHSGVIPCAELKTIKRQDPGLIIINSHRIKDGKHLEIQNENKNGDFYWFFQDNPEIIQREIIDLVKKRVPKKFGFDPLREIQVISPFREKTILSVKTLNEELQDALNRKPQIGKSRFRVGDKVIQKKNDYELDIINGDIGIVLGADDGNKKIVVQFDNPKRVVTIPLYENNLHLAYCCTCHSYQGSEAPCIIIPMHKSFGTVLMQRNWIYTAVTRAQKLCLVVGQLEVARKAIRRNDYLKRYTMLERLLADGAKEGSVAHDSGRYARENPIPL